MLAPPGTAPVPSASGAPDPDGHSDIALIG